MDKCVCMCVSFSIKKIVLWQFRMQCFNWIHLVFNFYYVQLASLPSKSVFSLLHSHQVKFACLYSWLCVFSSEVRLTYLKLHSWKLTFLHPEILSWQSILNCQGVLCSTSFSMFNWYVLSEISSFLVLIHCSGLFPFVHPSCNDCWAMERG